MNKIVVVRNEYILTNILEPPNNLIYMHPLQEDPEVLTSNQLYSF